MMDMIEQVDITRGHQRLPLIRHKG